MPDNNEAKILNSASEYFEDSSEKKNETSGETKSEIKEKPKNEIASGSSIITDNNDLDIASFTPEDDFTAGFVSPLAKKKEEDEVIPDDVQPKILFKGFIPQRDIFKRKGKYLWAVDLGSHTIKVVGLRERRKKLNIIYLSLVEILPGYPLPEQEKSHHRAVVNALAKSTRGIEDWQRNCFTSSIGSNLAVVRQIQYPMAVKDKLLSALKWEARKYIPYEPEEVVVDAQVLAPDENTDKMEVLLAAVPTEHLKYHRDTLSEVGLNPIVVNTDSLALMNALMAQLTLKKGETVLLIDVGAKTTTLNMYKQGGQFFTRSLSIAGERFSRELKASLKLSFQQAEQLKRGEATKENEIPPEKLLKILKPSYEQLYSEIQKSSMFYRKQTGVKDFHYLFITGGGANSPGLKKFLSKKMGKNIAQLFPLANLEVDGKTISKNILNQFSSQIALAVGMVLCAR